jgi:hypothetical protein
LTLPVEIRELLLESWNHKRNSVERVGIWHPFIVGRSGGAGRLASRRLGRGVAGGALADVVTLQRRRAGAQSGEDEEGLFLDTIAEYQWARDVAGLAATTLDRLVKPIIEVCDHFGLPPWRLTPRHIDSYFAGSGRRGGRR